MLRARTTGADGRRDAARAAGPLVIDDASDRDLNRQITALTEIVGALATTVAQLSDRVENPPGANRPRGQGDTDEGHEPGAWVWFSPPAAAEDDPDTTDARLTVDSFVAWYTGAGPRVTSGSGARSSR